MASNSVDGYDLNWLEDPPDDLKCLCMARDPHLTLGSYKHSVPQRRHSGVQGICTSTRLQAMAGVTIPQASAIASSHCNPYTHNITYSVFNVGPCSFESSFETMKF